MNEQTNGTESRYKKDIEKVDIKIKAKIDQENHYVGNLKSLKKDNTQIFKQSQEFNLMRNSRIENQ